MADGGGPTEQDRSEGMPSISEAPNDRGKALGYLGLFQVTRRKGGTFSGRYRRNGYVFRQNHPGRCQAAIAGKPAPTGIGYDGTIQVGCQAAIAGKPAPTGIEYDRKTQVGCQIARVS